MQQQLTKCILILAWTMAIGAQCPSWFKCSGTQSCYLIYPTDNGWKYQDPDERIRNAENDVYASPNCYKFIRKTIDRSSCFDAQRECEQVGGNITVINSTDEYEQLTNNVLHVLKNRDDSTFNIHVQNLPRDDIRMGCATIEIHDGPGIINNVYTTNTDCDETCMVDTIVCESTDFNTEICPIQVTEVAQTTTVQQTMSVFTTVSKSFVTEETTEKYTSMVFMHPSKGNQSEIETGPGVPIVAIIMSIVVITIAIILLVLLFMRRSQKRKRSRNSLGPNQHLQSTGLPVDKDGATVSYSDGGVVHKYSTAEDHQDRSEAYNILDAKYIHSPTVVVNDVYGSFFTNVPFSSPTNSAQDQEHDILRPNGMDSGAAKQNGLGGGVYAVPNKKAKAHNGETNQDVDEPYATLDADDMQPVSEHHERESDNAFDDALYVNANAHCLQDEGEAYNALNAADMHSDRDNSGDVYDVPYKETGDRQEDHGNVYDMLNRAEVRLGNEYDKLNAPDNMAPKDDMYSYVETAVGCGIVTMSPGEEDHAYDKLQRNTKLDGASINGNNYNTLQ
ncbi:uncharacterized protein LOC117119950 [Anneissia japonica]|uniref:uncharacterized protein LOC117119950 n=1 Tax=Anneissia japonica TaxID=1529436 RepID=UPI001425938D|nr:uncharacterized protein LOC117119950 [Anneissia japonica]